MKTLLRDLHRGFLALCAALVCLPVSLPAFGIGFATIALASSASQAYPLVRPAARGEVRRVARRTARRTTRRINTLPVGYRQVYMYGVPYYYAGGRYYQQSGNVYIEIEFD